jgi:hypothetical protein
MATTASTSVAHTPLTTPGPAGSTDSLTSTRDPLEPAEHVGRPQVHRVVEARAEPNMLADL